MSYLENLQGVLAGAFCFGPACLHAQGDASSSRFAHLTPLAWAGGGGPSRAAPGECFYCSDDSVPLLGECFNNIGGVHGVEL